MTEEKTQEMPPKAAGEATPGTAITTAAPVRQAIVNTDDTENAILLDTNKMNALWKTAGMYSRCSMIGKMWQGHPDDCFVACELAIRMKVSPFMLMQNMYVVPGSGKGSFLGSFVIGMINTKGPFSGPVQWKFTGQGKARACTAYATHAKTGEVCECTIDWNTVEGEGWTKNSKWKTMPDQMFRYRTAAWLARTYCPEVLMGMAAEGEVEDSPPPPQMIDAASTPAGTSRTDDLAKRLSQQPDASPQAPPIKENVDNETGELLPPPSEQEEPGTNG
jgi:hypothetical protein